MSNHKIYIASPFFNEEQLDEVKQLELICEKCHYDYFSPRKSQSTDFVKTLNKDDFLFELGKKFFFLDDIVQLDDCDTIIVNPNNLDSGTLFELGYAIAKKIRIFPSHQKYDKLIKDLICTVMNNSDYYKDIVFDDCENKYIFAESSDMKYEGLSKVFLGYFYAKGYNIYYFDIPRKSNIMLTSACSVYECKDETSLIEGKLIFKNWILTGDRDMIFDFIKEQTFVTGREDD